MEHFDFNAYENALINAMIQAKKTISDDDACIEVRSLIRKSVWQRLQSAHCTPYQCKQTSDIAMDIVDKVVELNLSIKD